MSLSLSLSASASTAVSGGGGDGSDGVGVGGGSFEFMLFGVRIKVDPLRKCVSLNNLSEYEPVKNSGDPTDKSDKIGDELQKAEAAAAVAIELPSGYHSADDVGPPSKRSRSDRKRGVPWTEEEHNQFLIGLQKVGKGDWRGISKNYVKTRTPTQVASHAQKYFLRKSNLNRRRRRSSLFDIPMDSVTEGSNNQIVPVPAPTPATVPVPAPTTALVPVPTTALVPAPTTVPVPAPQVMPPAAIPHPPRPDNRFPMMPLPVTAGPVFFSMQGGHPLQTRPLFFQPVLVHHLPTPTTTLDLNAYPNETAEPPSLSLGLSLSTGSGLNHSAAGESLELNKFKSKESRVSVVA